MSRKRNAWIVGIIVSLVIIFGINVYFRINRYYNTLINTDERRITIGYIYDYSGGKNYYYSYCFKYDTSIYFSSSSGELVNTSKLDEKKIEYVTVVHSRSDPSVHCVIWNKKFENEIKLGTELDLDIPDKVIHNYTFGIGMSPWADPDKEAENELKLMGIIKD